MVSAREIVLSCQGCGKKFRITVDDGVLLDHPVPCPSCKTDILTTNRNQPDIKTVFGRSQTPRVVDAQARDDKQGRKFKDVTKVAVDRTVLPQRTDLRKKITPQSVELPKTIAPLPESSRPQRHKPVQEIKPPMPVVDPNLAQSPALQIENDAETELEPSIKLRQENGEEVLFDKEGIKQLIRSRTWLGAFETELSGKWISLERHPSIPVLEKELRSEAQMAMVSISQEIDRVQDDPIQTAPKFNKLAYIIPLSFVLVSLAALYTYSQWPEPEVEPPPVVVIPPPQSAIDASLRVQAVAKEISFSASSFRQKSREDLSEMSNQSLAKSNFGDALDTLYELERRDPTDSTVVEKLVQAYLGTGAFRDARRAVVRLVALDGKTKKSSALFDEALRRDPNLKPEILEIGPAKNIDVDLIKVLGGGKSISFKFKKDGKNVYAFKPSQFEWEDGWESEVAAFRFCEIATCGFRVPRSRTAKISHQNFFRLYPMGSESQKNYAKRFENLRWKTEKVGGKKVKFLYGVLKDWVPRMVDWPIEYTELWSPWLDPQIPIETRVAALPALNFLKKKNRAIWRKLRSDMNLPVGRVAGELSNIMSFDYLTNNWDRFSEKEDFYGVNNQFSDGHFLSLDNGASFGFRHSLRVEKRFQQVGRFSRTFVASVRLSDAKIDPYLFPSQTKNAKKKLVFFHERRQTFLKHISKSLKENEKNNILRFE